RVGEIRMPTGKLLYVERPAFAGEKWSQVGIERLEIRLFAGTDGRCAILEIRQRALLKASMPRRPVLVWSPRISCLAPPIASAKAQAPKFRHAASGIRGPDHRLSSAQSCPHTTSGRPDTP